MIKSNMAMTMGLRDFNEVGIPLFIWKYGYPLLCDHHDDYEYILTDHHKHTIYQESNFQNIQNGDILWFKDWEFYYFLDHIYPTLDNNIYFAIMIASNHDWTIPSRWNSSYLSKIQSLLESDQLLHIFAENYDAFYYAEIFKHNSNKAMMDKLLYKYKSKFSGIPIGLDFHNSFENFHNKAWRLHGHLSTPMQQFNILQNMLSNREQIPLIEHRQMKVYVDYTLNIAAYKPRKYDKLLSTYADNRMLFKHYYYWTMNVDGLSRKRDALRAYVLNCITNEDNMNKDVFEIADKRLIQYDLFEQRSKYMFLLSVAGNGLDCFRLWEGILFGSIVIVQSSPLDYLYIDNNLPVVIVNQWHEINQTMLSIWYLKYKHLTYFENYETRQTMKLQHWMSYMRNITYTRLKEFTM